MKTIRILLIALAAQSFLVHGAFAATKVWAAVGDGDWNTAGNWSPSGVPGVGDDVVLNNTAPSPLIAYTVDIGGAGVASCRTLNVGGGAALVTLRISSTAIGTTQGTAPLWVVGEGTAGVDDISINANGRIYNSSTAASGNVVYNTGATNTSRVKNNGIYKHDSVRTVIGPFPAPGVAGGTTFEPTSLFEAGPLYPSSGAITINGYVFGNVTLVGNPLTPSPGTVFTWTATGAANPALRVVVGTLTLGPNVQMTSTPGATSAIRFNNIVNNGNLMIFGAAIDNLTPERGNILTGTPSVLSGTGAYRISGNLTIGTPSTPTAALQLNSALTIASGANFALQCNENAITGTGSITASTNGSLRMQHPGGFNGQFSGLPALPATVAGTNYRFGGTLASVTGAGMPATGAGVTFLNNAGVTLTNPLTVTAVAGFTSGTVTTSGGAPLTIGPASAPSRAKGYVIGDGYTQTLRGGVVAGSTRTIHVGTGAQYSPITIVFSGAGATTGTLKVVPTATQHPDVTTPGKAIKRFWTLTPASLGVFSATLSFVYDNADIAGLDPGFQEFSLKAERRNGLVWEVQNGSTNASTNTTTATGVTGFSVWTLEAVAITQAQRRVWEQFE